MHRRILLGILPLTAAVLVATALGLERAMYYDLLGALDTQLVNLVRTVGGGIGVDVDGAMEFDLSPEIVAQFEGEGLAPYYTVRSQDGKILKAWGTANSLAPPPGDAPHCGSGTKDVGFRVCAAFLEIEADAEAEDLEEWARAHPGTPVPEVPAQRFWVEVGLSLSGLKQSLAAFRVRLATGFGALFLILILVPVWSVRRALQPLEALSREAEAIDAEHLGSRLTEVGVDAEVQSLVSALNRALDRVADAYERQKRFTSDAAHELRTPLSVIRTQSEIALRKPRPAAELLEALGVVQKAALRLTDLMESLLLLSRHDAGAVRFRPEPVDLAEVAEGAVDLLRVAAEAKGLRLECSFSGPVPAWGDPSLLGTCLLKLLENAVRFTPAGGSIRVEASPLPTPRVSVEDTGRGIPREEHARIFERFYRVDPSRSRADGGTGLGLAIAQGIAQLHGARIDVRSESGKGSRFELVLSGGPSKEVLPP